MKKRTGEKWVAVGMVLVCAAGAQAVNIVTVPVGNAGNANDTHGDGYGGVAHEYDIGKYEVTNTQYREFLNAADPTGIDQYNLYNSEMGTSIYGGISFDAGAANGSKYTVRTDRGNKPVNFVSFWDAARFANWMHNGQGNGDTETGSYINIGNQSTFDRQAGATWVIPSEDEWYKAAYYDGGSSVYWDYATRSDTIPTAEEPPGSNTTNGSANYGNAVDDLTDVGAYTFKPSDSAYGTFDQNGNMWEWNDTIIGSKRGVRGGSFSENGDYLSAAHRGENFPYNSAYNVGFRVAWVPEPATIALLALGGLVPMRSGLRRRRGV